MVLEDISRQVEAGAQHITFGDPDFFNGPGHTIPILVELHAGGHHMPPERLEYRDHRIELRAREGLREEQPELLIDDEPVRYGQLPDGSYALNEYAYDWHDNLIDLAKRCIDYRDQVDEMRREDESGAET